jgi:hypothetical protein
VELIKNFRFSSQHLADLNESIRTGQFKSGNESDFNIFQSLNSPQLANLPFDTLFVTSTRAVRDTINKEAVCKTASDTNPVVRIWAHHHLGKLKKKKKMRSTDDGGDDAVEYVSADEVCQASSLDFHTREFLLKEK